MDNTRVDRRTYKKQMNEGRIKNNNDDKEKRNPENVKRKQVARTESIGIL